MPGQDGILERIDQWAATLAEHPRGGLLRWTVFALAAICVAPVLFVPFGFAEQVALGLVFIGAAVYLSVFAPELRLAIGLLSATASLRYIIWRGDKTLNFASPMDATFSIALFLAELYGISILLLGYFQTVELVRRKAAPAPAEPELPTVDVFVPTYNEEVSILRRTITGALALDYPRKRVYLLDDGQREEMRVLARELGCEYITRETNAGAKAGNVNNALAQTSGDLVAIFDADHVPVASFLRETIGFFGNRRVALVQTPHHFYNPDPFERNLGLEGHIAPENDFFYQVVQVGNDFWNSAFFCGSCAVLRRSALDEVGGLATDTVTEDAHTALNLHAAGYESVYYAKPVAAGLATERFSSHIAQRMRWARGMIQILRIDNPLLKPGLHWPQRLNYLSAMIHFLFGIPRIIFILAPLAYLLFGIDAIRGMGLEVLAYALPHIAIATIANSIVSHSYRNSFWAEIYESAIAFYVSPVTMLALVNPRLGRFNVTRKGDKIEEIQYDWRSALPVLALLGLAIAGLVAFAPWRWFAYPEERVAISINALWMLYGLILLIPAALVARERPQQRRAPRVERRYVCRVTTPSGATLHCETHDMSETGLRLVYSRPVPLPDRFEVELANPFGAPVRARGRIAWRAIGESGRTSIGFEFLDMTAQDRLSIIRLMFSGTESWTEREVPPDSIVRSWWLVFTSLWRARRARQVISRAAPRVTIPLSCKVSARGGSFAGTTIDVSELGAAINLDAAAWPLPSRVDLTVHTGAPTPLRLEAKVVRHQLLSSGAMLVAVRFERMTFALRQELGEAIYGRLARTAGEPVEAPVGAFAPVPPRGPIFTRVLPPPRPVPPVGSVTAPRVLRRVDASGASSAD